jgi:ABC-type proline/glycine betaine transport system permease subunit
MMSGPSFDYVLPLRDWIQTGVEWLVVEWRPLFQVLRWPIAQTLDAIEAFLLGVPFFVFLGALFLFASWVAGWRIGLFSAIAMFFIGLIEMWQQSMTTLAMILTTLIFNFAIGVPLGLIAARSDRFWAVLRVVLDVMQTTPSFVYLVPVVMLFGVGTVPGVIATIIFAIAPVIRMTNLGIRQVAPDIVEAGHAFGSTNMQVLREIQLPLALPVIMAGLNQTLLLSIAMSTIASMIGAEGLGLTVLRGISRLDVGLAATGGLSLVLMAIIIDRISQAVGHDDHRTVYQAETLRGRLMRAIFGRPPKNLRDDYS